MSVQGSIAELSLRYSTPLFPIRIEDLAEELPTVGFVVGPTIDRTFLGRVHFSGTIAQKGDLSFILGSDRGIWAVRGVTPEDIVREFEAVEKMISTRFGIKPGVGVYFYEYQAQATVDAGRRTAQEIMTSHLSDLPAVAAVGRVLDQPVAGFGLRLGSAGVIPNSPTWCDVRLEPDAIDPGRFLAYVLVRAPERTKVVDVARRGAAVFEELVQAVRS